MGEGCGHGGGALAGGSSGSVAASRCMALALVPTLCSVNSVRALSVYAAQGGLALPLRLRMAVPPARRRLGATLAAAALMAVGPIFVTASQNEDGGYDYSVPMANLFSELLKLQLSGVALTVNAEGLRRCCTRAGGASS